MAGRWAACLIIILLAGCSNVPMSANDEPGPLFSSTHVFRGTYDTTGPYARPLAMGPFDAGPAKDTVLESPVDRAAIHIRYVTPDGGGPFPVVVRASPYLPMDLDLAEVRTARFADALVSHGFAFAVIAVRGTSGSGGCNDLWGPAEAADLDHAVHWLGRQPWSNGAVGMLGRSYDAAAAWEVAAKGNPYLKTIVPISGSLDAFSWMWRNGTVKAYEAAAVQAVFWRTGLEQDPQQVVCPGAWQGVLSSATASATLTRDEFWQDRDWRDEVLANYRGSVLLVHGLQDWTTGAGNMYPFIHELEKEGVVVKHLLGQWSHAFPDVDPGRNPAPRWDWAEIYLRWFEFWLRGNATDIGPRVQVQDSAGAWRSDDAWPPLDAVPSRFYLLADGTLRAAPAGASASFDVAPMVLVPDPQKAQANSTLELWSHPVAAECPRCPAFETEPFPDGLHFAGLPRVHVTVTPTGPGGYIGAWLYVVGDDVRRVGWGGIDLRFAAGGEEARPVAPGVAMVARMELQPLDVAVPPGASLRLVFHQAGFGDNHAPTAPLPVQLIAGGMQSSITVDAFEPTSYFTPP